MVRTRDENIAHCRAIRRDKEDRKLAILRENQRSRALRTPSQQLDVLDARLGYGVGAKKERKRLLAQMIA